MVEYEAERVNFEPEVKKKKNSLRDTAETEIR